MSYDLSNHFQRLWTTLTHNFKISPLFDAEYLKNGTTHRHSFNEMLIGTHTRPTQLCHFESPRVMLSDWAKYSVTRSPVSGGGVPVGILPIIRAGVKSTKFVCPHNGTYNLCISAIFSKIGFADIVPLCSKPLHVFLSQQIKMMMIWRTH